MTGGIELRKPWNAVVWVVSAAAALALVTAAHWLSGHVGAKLLQTDVSYVMTVNEEEALPVPGPVAPSVRERATVVEIGEPARVRLETGQRTGFLVDLEAGRPYRLEFSMPSGPGWDSDAVRVLIDGSGNAGEVKVEKESDLTDEDSRTVLFTVLSGVSGAHYIEVGSPDPGALIGRVVLIVMMVSAGFLMLAVSEGNLLLLGVMLVAGWFWSGVFLPGGEDGRVVYWHLAGSGLALVVWAVGFAAASLRKYHRQMSWRDGALLAVMGWVLGPEYFVFGVVAGALCVCCHHRRWTRESWWSWTALVASGWRVTPEEQEIDDYVDLASGMSVGAFATFVTVNLAWAAGAL